MNYQKWTLATNFTTMFVTIIALVAAVTYYFSLTNLEPRYYFITYLILLITFIFIFSSILLIRNRGEHK
tara:strand:- start:429 stop:635 length:207 start_codon:yes stop_codon:yes gene_type:complete